MKNLFKLTAVALSVVAGTAQAASYATDARGEAMGGVGAVSATYLTAPFYNPALTAIYRRNDDAGMLLPSLGLMYDDESQLLDNIDTIVDLDLSNPNNEQEAEQLLNDLANAQSKVELGGAVAFGLPNQYISATVFGKAYSESFIESVVDTDPNSTVGERLDNSGVKAVSIGVTEAGISLAKYYTLLGQHVSFGVSPKLQRIYTYSYAETLDGYDLSDIRDNGQGETMFNMDAGALWFSGPLRIGFSAKNLVSRDIETKRATSGNVTVQGAYKLEPQYTLGAGFVMDYASLSVDYDLREEKKFEGFNDNTQMLRVGAEVDIMRQLYLRAGYKKNLVGTEQDTVTAGVGFAPLGLFELDVAASYTDKNAMGAYVNFLATY
ncbi:conjugal transfer protein TraF [Vibrio maerlii]|uniref:conjugal transfer protein TraF n=1 Tax=Vibrio maerlii TaxID=2231648 RepID=UPI000E3D4CEB|nr:conjugal transfer protein TraF [Vibrio maerlii]